MESDKIKKEDVSLLLAVAATPKRTNEDKLSSVVEEPVDLLPTQDIANTFKEKLQAAVLTSDGDPSFAAVVEIMKSIAPSQLRDDIILQYMNKISNLKKNKEPRNLCSVREISKTNFKKVPSNKSSPKRKMEEAVVDNSENNSPSSWQELGEEDVCSSEIALHSEDSSPSSVDSSTSSVTNKVNNKLVLEMIGKLSTDVSCIF
uniref:BESS domain-containing protein n=1 Tax=Rhabditophanes sp. KR3021 TaxID=114890 RepID=A0AC35UET5_9BILA